jgi:hypothetical protein
MKMVNLDTALHHGAQPDLVPLRRFDVVFVPRTGLANFSLVMSEIRDSLPISFSYAAGSTAAIF